MTKTQVEDLAERAGWTLAQAAVAFGITEAASIKEWWALPIATALSAAKTWIVNHRGKTSPEGTSPQEAP